MEKARITLVILLLTGLVNAVTYTPLTPVWNITLGGDTLDVRDVDGDGKPDITIGLFRAQGSYAYLLDNGGTLKWRNKISVIWPQNSPNTLMVDDIDGNGNTDIAVGSVVEAKTCSAGLSEYNHPIFVLERDPTVENNMLKWVHRGYGYSTSLYVADVAGEEDKEVISGSRDGTIYVVNSDGTLRWKYTTEGTVNTVYAADLNNDKVTEVLAGSYNYLHALNYMGNRRWRYNPGAQVMALYAADINNDKLREVLAVSDNDILHVVSSTGKQLWNHTLDSLKPTVTAADLDGDNHPEVLIASADLIYALDHRGRVKWHHDVGYPIVQIAAVLTDTSQINLIALGARHTTAYSINSDYLKDLAADDNLADATRHYNQGRFPQARNHAMQAIELYSELGDTGKVTESHLVLNQSLLYIEADRLYEQAVGNYSEGEYEKAKGQAVEAERLYIEVGDADRTNKALKLVNNAIDQIDALHYYHRALEYYRARNYVEGGVYSKKALDLYILLDDKANIRKTERLFNNTAEYPLANKNYDLALREYEAGNYTLAREYAEKARKSYETVGDAGRTSSTLTLLSNIEDKIEEEKTRDNARQHYARAYGKYNTSNYHGCKEEVEKAVSLYTEIEDKGGQEKSRSLFNVCERGISAQQDYAQAFEYYTNMQFEIAKDYAAKARQEYRSIEDLDGAIKCGNLILEIDDEQKQTEKKSVDVNSVLELLPYVAVAAAGLIVLALIYLAVKRFRKRKPEREKPVKKKGPDVDYTRLLPAEPAPEAPKKEWSLDDIVAEQPAVEVISKAPATEAPAPEAPAPEAKAEPETPPEATAQKPVEEAGEDIAAQLEDILGKLGGPEEESGGEPAPAAPTAPTAPAAPESPAAPAAAPEPEPQTQDALELIAPEEPAVEKPSKPAAKEKEEPAEAPKEKDDLKMAEKIKKELKDINEKISK
jgi:hypothetical protein